MANEQITFDKLPQAVGYLTEQMEQIRQMVAALQPQASSDKHRLVEIDEACKITRKAKPTIYTLAENEKRFMENTYNTYKEEERKKETNALIPSLSPDEEHIPKVGRNEPCPCGSGKKFKKCCGG